MKLYVTEAKYENGYLMFKTPMREETKKITDGFKVGDVEIIRKEEKKKRSLDSNAYFWSLLDKLSAVLHKSKEEIYREAIKDIGGVSEIVCVKTEAVSMLVKAWVDRGLGWQADVVPSKIKGCSNVILYYGSSMYDSKQMSRLIDHVVQDCKACGIETLPPEELERLNAQWAEKQS